MTEKIEEKYLGIQRILITAKMIEDKKVCSSGTAGAIYVPKKFIGQTFRVILIPINNDIGKSKLDLIKENLERIGIPLEKVSINEDGLVIPKELLDITD